ncbi:hypothetical protein HPC49_52485, partial [Pyxidicoccus fallax]|uniref:condensation domain-containing protein n=1 Tax=Pyxidicoccus fallax TaxID=394095 RepID=UPI0020A66D9A
PRPTFQSHRGAAFSFSLSASLTDSLTQLAHESGATLFMVLLASWQVLLSRYSDQTDFCVGTPIAGRTRQETEPLIGFFVNTLVLRARLEGDPTFTQLLAQVKDSALGAFAHQDVPFEQLVDELGVVRDLSRSPLFQVAFALQNAPIRPPALSGLRVDGVAAPTQTSKFDLSLTLVEHAGALEASFEYCVDLFEPASIQRLASHFVSLLEGIAANPFRALSQLPPEAPLQLPPLRPQPLTASEAPPSEFLAPRTPVEQSLAAIWSEVLEVPAPGVHDSFFQLGGSSLSSVLMLARVEESFGTEVRLERFFQSPTIASLAAALQSEAPQQMGADSTPMEVADSPLVLLQKGGSRTPIFCVHPIGGDVFCYIELARQLGDEQPFYGLRARDSGATGESDTSLEALARAYLASIRSVQPAGPYRLMGWSMGGNIAFELARQLEAQGEEVELLALIDAYARPLDRLAPNTDLGEVAKELLASELQQLPEHLDHPRIAALHQRLERHLRLLSTYEPGTYGGELVLLQATDVVDPSIQAHDNGWHSLVSQGIKVHGMPGNHYTILRPPNVQCLVEQLRAYLQKRSRESTPALSRSQT